MHGDQVTETPPTPAGAVSWLTIQDDLLRTLAHSVSNRVGTILALTGTLQLGAPASAQTVTILRDEADRLEQLLHRLRLLPRREDSASEPMLLADAITSAWGLGTEHPLLRDRALQVDGLADAPPVRADPTAVTQACAAMLLAVGPAADGAPLAVRVDTVGEGRTQMVECRVHGVHDAARRDRHAAAIAFLLEPSHGEAMADDGQCGFRLPTLSATRAFSPAARSTADA